MNMVGTQRVLRPLRSLLMVFVSVAGLMMCLTVMHGLHAEHLQSAESVTATAMVSHHDTSSLTPVAATSGAAECAGPCGTNHVMTAAECAVALLVSLVLVGAARMIATGWPTRGRMLLLAKRIGTVLDPIPPSLLALSISRT